MNLKTFQIKIVVIAVSSLSCVQVFGHPMDCSPLSSAVHGILLARTQEWVAIPFLQGVFQTKGSNPRLLHWQVDFFTDKPPGKHK